MLLLFLSASAPEDMVIDGLGARNQAFWAANCDLCSKNLTLELFFESKSSVGFINELNFTHSVESRPRRQPRDVIGI